MRKLVPGELIEESKKLLKEVFNYTFQNFRIEAHLKRAFKDADGERLVALFGTIEESYIEMDEDGFLYYCGAPTWNVYKCLNTFRDFDDALKEARKFKEDFIKDGLKAIGITTSKKYGHYILVLNCSATSYKEEYHIEYHEDGIVNVRGDVYGIYSSEDLAVRAMYKIYEDDVSRSVFCNFLRDAKYDMYKDMYRIYISAPIEYTVGDSKYLEFDKSYDFL